MKSMERVISFPNTPKELRLQHKNLRQSMEQHEVVHASDRICERLSEASWYQNSTWIYGYYPLGKEVDCRNFLEMALSAGKRVALPRMATEPALAKVYHMDFFEIYSFEQTVAGKFGVLEPDVTCSLVQEREAVVLVPGVVFDKNGNRYGYGKGYYDRYFARFPELYKVALAYENQIEEELIVSQTDVKMDCIYTEQKSRLLTERKKDDGIIGNL